MEVIFFINYVLITVEESEKLQFTIYSVYRKIVYLRVYDLHL